MDGVPITKKSADEVEQILKSNTGDRVRVEFLPASMPESRHRAKTRSDDATKNDDVRQVLHEFNPTKESSENHCRVIFVVDSNIRK